MKPYPRTKSEQRAERARRVIPGASMSNFRRHIDHHPIYITHGKGARLYDVDGNEYIDYSLGYGPAILGHSNEHLEDALSRQARRLHTPNSNDLEVEAAEKVAAHIACAELVRFSCSGTEANLGNLRVARAFTGRQKYVRFNGHYHGGLDHAEGGLVVDPDEPVPVEGELEEDIFSQFTNTDGRFKEAFRECYMLEWNDLPAFKKLLGKRAGEIAAVIMEPTMVNNAGCMPEPGYLEGVRQLCNQHGIVLIFDEVLTGFRIDLKGAQGYFGVTPDLTTLAKALGGGFPVSSFCGRREIMDTITRGDVVQGGTYNGNPLAMAAVIATIEELEAKDGEAFGRIRKLGTMLKDGLDRIAKELEQPLLLQGFPGAWTVLFTPEKKIINHAGCLGSDFSKGFRFSELLAQRGVMMGFRFCTSAAHTEKDVGDALDRAADAMKELREEAKVGVQA